MLHHVRQLQAFGPTCWIWWILKRPLGCMCRPPPPRASLPLSAFVSPFSDLLSVPIDYQNSLSTLRYITSSPQRGSACWRFSSSLRTRLILSRGERLQLAVFQPRWAERAPCPWHTIPSAGCHVPSTLPSSDVTWQVRVCVWVCVCVCFIQPQQQDVDGGGGGGC